MLILNDIHLGVNRQGGTTPASREALRSYLFSSFTGAVMETTENHICILGDLFDQFEVEGRDWISTYLILQSWLGRGGKLTLVAGNHDHSQKALRVSSFEMLCKVLDEQFEVHVHVVGIDQFCLIEEGVIALAHCSNQEIFNAKLKEVLSLATAGDRILLHANYDNGYAAQSDHSLNVSREQVMEFRDKGVFLYFAHEHQATTGFSGHVTVFGNQWPSSISDCLNNDVKYAHILAPGVTAIQVATWGRNDQSGYAEIDWRDLAEVKDLAWQGFAKVTGTASSNEAGECISAIAKFRSKSQAFVITNGVKIEGIAENSDLPEAFEATKAFDVNEFVDQNLDPAQLVAVNKLRGATA